MVQSVATRCRPVGTLDRWLVCEEGRGSQLDTQLGSRLAFSPTPSQASWHPCICLLPLHPHELHGRHRHDWDYQPTLPPRPALLLSPGYVVGRPVLYAASSSMPPPFFLLLPFLRLSVPGPGPTNSSTEAHPCRRHRLHGSSQQ